MGSRSASRTTRSAAGARVISDARAAFCAIVVAATVTACGGGAGASGSGGGASSPDHGAADATRARAIAESRCNEQLGRGARLYKEGRYGWAFVCNGAEQVPGVGLLVVFRDGTSDFMTTSVSPDLILQDLERGHRPRRGP